jgi:hypothetical protein
VSKRTTAHAVLVPPNLPHSAASWFFVRQLPDVLDRRVGAAGQRVEINEEAVPVGGATERTTLPGNEHSPEV